MILKKIFHELIIIVFLSTNTMLLFFYSMKEGIPWEVAFLLGFNGLFMLSVFILNMLIVVKKAYFKWKARRGEINDA